MKPSDRIEALGISLPEAPTAVANYVPVQRVGNFLFVSGQLCLDGSGTLVAKGKVDVDVSAEQATEAARTCAINILAQCRAALGSIDHIARVVRLGGFITCSPEYEDHAKVMNGASDLMVEVFGESGRHTRSTVGVTSLPKGAAVEVDAIFEIA